jgi:hypothetical protein
MRKNWFAFILLAVILLSNCAGAGEHARVDERTPADHLARNLHALSENVKTSLKNNFNTKEVYVIVHPSYYIFFHKKPFEIPKSESKNMVQAFVETDFMDESPTMSLMKEYERTEMEFISSARKDNKIVLLVLPGKYLNSKQYLYKQSPDPYTKYLNDSTQGSENIFYIETKNSSSGKLRANDRVVVLDFLKRLGAKKIFVGGGYVGRCQKEFYTFLSSNSEPDIEISIIPELSAISPNDISDSGAKMLLTSDMRLNTWAAQYFIKNELLHELKVNITNLPTNSRISPENNQNNNSR